MANFAVNIKDMLRRRGKTLRAWAIEMGYPPSTVYSVVRRWENRTDRIPHGGFGRQIMAGLKKEMAK